MAAFDASVARSSPDPIPIPISADPAPDMTDFTSAKSRLISPGVVMSDVMPSTPWNRTWSAIRNASTIGMLGSATWSRPIVRHDDEGVDRLLQFGDTQVGLRGALASFEPERSRHDPDREGSESSGDLRHDRSAAGPGAAALAGGDEHHVGALEDLLDLIGCARWRPLCRPRDRSRHPSPRVVSRPMSSLTSASDISSVWASVLTAMNSTPRRPASIIRFTAFTPPPPIPTTLITAR